MYRFLNRYPETGTFGLDFWHRVKEPVPNKALSQGEGYTQYPSSFDQNNILNLGKRGSHTRVCGGRNSNLQPLASCVALLPSHLHTLLVGNNRYLRLSIGLSIGFYPTQKYRYEEEPVSMLALVPGLLHAGTFRVDRWPLSQQYNTSCPRIFLKNFPHLY